MGKRKKFKTEKCQTQPIWPINQEWYKIYFEQLFRTWSLWYIWCLITSSLRKSILVDRTLQCSGQYYTWSILIITLFWLQHISQITSPMLETNVQASPYSALLLVSPLLQTVALGYSGYLGILLHIEPIDHGKKHGGIWFVIKPVVDELVTVFPCYLVRILIHVTVLF